MKKYLLPAITVFGVLCLLSFGSSYAEGCDKGAVDRIAKKAEEIDSFECTVNEEGYPIGIFIYPPNHF